MAWSRHQRQLDCDCSNPRRWRCTGPQRPTAARLRSASCASEAHLSALLLAGPGPAAAAEAPRASRPRAFYCCVSECSEGLRGGGAAQAAAQFLLAAPWALRAGKRLPPSDQLHGARGGRICSAAPGIPRGAACDALLPLRWRCACAGWRPAPCLFCRRVRTSSVYNRFPALTLARCAALLCCCVRVRDGQGEVGAGKAGAGRRLSSPRRCSAAPLCIARAAPPHVAGGYAPDVNVCSTHLGNIAPLRPRGLVKLPGITISAVCDHARSVEHACWALSAFSRSSGRPPRFLRARVPGLEYVFLTAEITAGGQSTSRGHVARRRAGSRGQQPGPAARRSSAVRSQCRRAAPQELHSLRPASRRAAYAGAPGAWCRACRKPHAARPRSNEAVREGCLRTRTLNSLQMIATAPAGRRTRRKLNERAQDARQL